MNPLPNQTGQYMPGTDNEEIHLHDYLNVLIRRRRIFWWGFCTVFLLVVLYTFLRPPVYEATASLQVTDEKVKGNGLLEDLGLSRDNPVETEIEILKSRTNAEEVVHRLHLDWKIDKHSDGLEVSIGSFQSETDNPEYLVTIISDQAYEIRGDSLKSPLRGTPGEILHRDNFELTITSIDGKPGDSFRLTQLPFNETVQDIRDNTIASEIGKGTNIIRLVFQSADPQLAQQVVNTLTQVYLERSVSLKSEEASRSVEFIGGQLDNFRSILDEAEKNLEAFKRESGVITLEDEARKQLSLITDIEKQAAEVQLQKKQAGFAINSLKKAIATGNSYAPSILASDSVVASLAGNLAEAEVEKRTLLADLTDNHPKVVAINERIQGLLNNLLETYHQIESSLGKTADELASKLHSLENKLKNLPDAERELARLTRQSTVSADIYTFLLQKHEEARIAKAATISNINVIDPAILPEKPIKPRKQINLLLGLIIGSMVGISLAFLKEYLDDTIVDVDSAKRLLGYPLLAVIPHIQQDNITPDSKERRTLISQLQPKSAATEAFRSLRTALHFTTAVHNENLFLVTSAFPGEGKTTIAANLAVIIANTGQKICLVGCDLRRPSLHELFEHDRSPGLTEVLIGDTELDDAIHDTIIDNLYFVSAGVTPPNPSELLGSKQMDHVLKTLSDRYDIVLLDAPPMLPVTDAALIAPKCGKTLMVLEAGGVPIKAAKRMIEIFHSIGADVAGLVFNDKTGKAAEYYNSYLDRSYGKYAVPYTYGYYSHGYGENELPRPQKRSWLKRLLRRP